MDVFEKIAAQQKGLRAQISMDGEIIVDNFAGGGGASTGLELAFGRVVDIAINHDRDAILMHKTNHPHAEHYQASVWDIDPPEVCRGRPVGLAWFSPDCKHFSKAKGNKPVDKNIRGLAWIALRWAGTVRPRVIILENVEEFQTWGPVRRGRPVKAKAGQTFRKFIAQLQGLGYTVEHRELVAADYGAPTTRKRFFMVARCDGRPVVWPEPTHAPRDSEAVKSGRLKPWRSADEIIDWTLPCPSIFEDKATIKEKYGLSAQRPLRPNTMRRCIRGLDKHVIRAAEPFIIPTGYGERQGQPPRVHDINAPVPTAVGTGKHAVVEPVMAPAPFVVEVNHAGDFRGQALDKPLSTVTAKHGRGLVSPTMAPWTLTNTSNSVGAPADEPVHTVTTAGNQILITPVLAALGQTGGGDRQRSIKDPTHTQVSKVEEMLVAPSLIQYHAEQSESVRGQTMDRPLMTVDAANRYGLTAATLTKYYSGANQAQDVGQPLHTITTKDREGVTLAHLVKMKGTNLGGSATDPLQTVTAGGLHHGLIVTKIVKADHGADLQHWPKIRALLNEHCGYQLAEDDVLLLQLGGAWWFVADIGLRMLTPMELYRANGFPPDYIIDRDYLGNEYKKDKQVARCGNAVPPPFATALARANLPEWCDGDAITTMAELERRVAV